MKCINITGWIMGQVYSILGITSSGGNGHKAALEALQKGKLALKGDTTKEVDMLKNIVNDSLISLIFRIVTLGLLGKLGDYCIAQWENAQARGDVDEQKKIVGRQWLAEILFHLAVYFSVKSHLNQMIETNKEILIRSDLVLAKINEERSTNNQLPLTTREVFLLEIARTAYSDESIDILQLATQCDELNLDLSNLSPRDFVNKINESRDDKLNLDDIITNFNQTNALNILNAERELAGLTKFTLDQVDATVVAQNSLVLMDSFFPKAVVSTQALCTNAIAQAILAVNQQHGCKIKFKHYMTDTTLESHHFYRSIAPMGQNPQMQKIYTLYVSSSESQREEDANVINTNCASLRVKYLSSPQFPIRKEFLDVQTLKTQLTPSLMTKSIKLGIKLHPTPETSTPEADIVALGGGQPIVENNIAQFDISDEDKVGFLMLGSKPSEQAVINWIKVMIENANKPDIEKRNRHFFVYCGAPEKLDEKGVLVQNNLLREVQNYLINTTLPEGLKIVPFTYQDASQLAILAARSDLSITRSGGSTCFELIQLAEAAEKGDIPRRENRLSIIHSEGTVPTPLIDQELIQQELLKTGIPLWEAGNATYLKKVLEANGATAVVSNANYAAQHLRNSFFNPVVPVAKSA